MRRHGGSRETPPLSQHKCSDQTGNSRVAVDDRSTGKIQHSHVPKKGSRSAPRHVADRSVHNGGPQDGEQENCREFHALGVGSGNQHGRDNGKSQLERYEDRFRYRPVETVDADTA